MFGLEILDIVIGLTFVYLLLALMATAVNEYLAALLNKRGEELAKGIARLLDDIDGKEALLRATRGVKASARLNGTLTEQFFSHPLIRPLATQRGWMGRALGMKDLRLPSYIPARTFALATLDILGYHDPNVRPGEAATALTPDDAAAAPSPSASQRAQLVEVLELLQRESPLDVSEHLGGLKGLLEHATLPDEMKVQLVGTVANAQTRLQKLHDSTEVWFNNSMDRVSGAYKRHTQAFLFLIGMVLACALNADTLQMWRQLAGNDALRTAMAQRAARLLPALDTLVHDTAATPANPDSDTANDTASAGAAIPATETADTTGSTVVQDDSAVSTPTDTTGAPRDSAASRPALPDSLTRAKEKYLAARTQLDSMELKLGWTWEEARRVGMARLKKDGTGYTRDYFPLDNRPGKFFGKLFGFFMTALAISMGAPFWFDILNKVISIRGAGRSPTERAKSPEGPAKRAAEQPNK